MTKVLLACAALLLAAQPEGEVPTRTDEFAGQSPREVVREGNQRLLEGDTGAALEAYEHAGAILPDAREIAYGRGLANYDLKRFDEARAAFEDAAAAGTDALATNAQYGLATCDHREGLDNTDNPELAVSLLESAIRRYQRVLSENPEHTAAMDAIRKAALVRRRIKEQQQQQPQPQPKFDHGEQNEDQQNQKDGTEPDESQENPDENQEQRSQQQSSDEDKQEQDKQQEPSNAAEDENQSESQSRQAQQQEQQQQQVSREQAERQLREMMQAVRERMKARREQVVHVPIAPVEKDW